MTTFVRMAELAEEAEACAQRIEASLDLTLSEGKKMLRFLGQPPPQEDLPGKVKSVCQTVAKFTSMLKGAIADVERYESRRAAESSNPEPGKLSSFGFTRRRRSSGSEAKILHKKLARNCIERALWKACMPCEAALPPLWEQVLDSPGKDNRDSSLTPSFSRSRSYQRSNSESPAKQPKEPVAHPVQTKETQVAKDTLLTSMEFLHELD